MFLDEKIVNRILQIKNLNDEQEVMKAIKECLQLCMDAVQNENIPKLREEFLKCFNRVTLLYNNAVKTLQQKGIYILKKDGIQEFFKQEFPEVYDKFYFIKHPEQKSKTFWKC